MLNLDSKQLERHRAFLNLEPTARPLVGSWLFPYTIPGQFPTVAAALEPGPVHPDDIPIEAFLHDLDTLWLEAYAELDDDYPLSTGAFYAVPWTDHSAGRYSCGPTVMRGVAELCAGVWIEVARTQLALLPESENGYMVGCGTLRCWMPEKGVWLQDDALPASPCKPWFPRLPRPGGYMIWCLNGRLGDVR